MTPADLPSTQLLVFQFAPGFSFQGGMVGALERIETGMSLRVVDALCVIRSPESDELQIFRATGDGAGSMSMGALDFRLDPGSRGASSAEALENDPELAAFSGSLQPGAALIAVLIQHRWAEDLADAVDRAGGAVAATRFVGASTLTELVPELVALR
jgi:hypothetical protein